jgi:hypothetical protein
MAGIYPVSPLPDEDGLRISAREVLDIAAYGKTLVVGETVYLGSGGIQVVASMDGNWNDQNAYTLVDNDGQDIGGLYGRDDAGQNIIGLRAVDPPANGDTVILQIAATADPANVSTAAARVEVAATRAGETADTFVTLQRDDNTSEIDLNCGENGRVRIAPLLMLQNGEAQCWLYIIGSKVVFKYWDATVYRYKYLDLSGAGAAWQDSTAEPD